MVCRARESTCITPSSRLLDHRPRAPVWPANNGEDPSMASSNHGPIGYKRPPRDCQFVPGQSGNPNGRPKGTRNFKTDLRQELNEIVSFREGDREVSISKQR